MSENTLSPTPKWFSIVAILALVWNLFGVVAYIGRVTMGPEAFAALPEDQQAYLESTPAWATAAFAFAVWGGAIGALLLALKKAWAYPVLIVSLIGVLVQMVHSFFIANSMEVYGPGGVAMPIMVLAVGFYLVWLARSAKSKGWII